MKRRALCLLLAILTVFAMAVPAFAAEEGEVDASGSIGNDLKWTLSGGTVTVSGTGEMFEYYEPDKWKKSQDLFEHVIIEPGVTGLRTNAFSYCENLKSVTFPDTLTSISARAFQACPGLTAVTIPGSVEEIGYDAFAQCTNLKDVTIGNGVKNIGGDAFWGCAMTGVTIPGSVTFINDGAFSYCKSLQSVTIPKSVTAIGGDAFRACSSLKEVTVLNPKCEIYGGYLHGEADTLGTPGTTVVYGYAGSTAETYANTYGYTFKDLSHMEAPTVKIAQTDSGIQVTWNAVSGSPQYMVYYKENGGSWQQIGTTSKTSYTRKASALKNGATYQFTVRCCAADKMTLLSTYKASNKVKYFVQLAAPAVKIAQTKSGIQVTWNAVKGSPLYMVYYKENGGSWQQIGTTSKTSYTRKASALKNGATYQFAVRCCAADKKTLLSSFKASNKVKYTVQLAAPAVKIAQVSGGIQVTWNAVKGSPLYMVYYKQNGGSWQQIGTTSKTSYTRKASALKNGATYQFTVRCCASDKKTLLGPYKASNSVKYTVELAAPAVKIAQTSGGIQVTWNAVSGSPQYMVYYKENGGSWQQIGTTSKTSYTRKASALKNGATYQFTVRCCAADKKTLLGPYKASNSVKYTVEQNAPSVPPVAAPTARPQTSGTYVLNTNSMKFHYPSCASAGRISAANRMDVTMSREEIIAQGYEPCKVCQP